MPTDDITANIKIMGDLKKMIMFQQELRKLNKLGVDISGGALKDMNGRFMEMNKAAKVGAPLLQKFRMEFLSIMFAGMMVANVMSQLLRPALEVTGFFELWSALLQVFFLPIAMFLLQAVLLPLLKWFMDAPEWVKVLVGAFVLVVLVIGKLMMIIGAVVLLFGALAVVAAIFGIGVGALILIILAIVVVFTLLVVGIYYLWKNWDKIWGWIKEKAKAVWDWILENVWKPIKDWVKTWIVDPIKNAWQWIVDNVWKPVKDWFKKWVIDPIADAWDWLTDKITAAWAKIKEIWTKMKEFFSGVWEKGKNAVQGFLGTGQTGIDYVPHTGLYKLHAGERVVPPEGNITNFSPSISINASSNVDIEMMKSQLSTQWRQDLERLAR